MGEEKKIEQNAQFKAQTTQGIIEFGTQRRGIRCEAGARDMR